MKNRLKQYILDTYGIEADHPFVTAPDTEIFRKARNKKWFAVLLGQLSKRCLGLQDDGAADVLNLKCDPIMTFSLIDNQRIFHAYHMDNDITMEELTFLVDLSYSLVDRRAKPKQKSPAK